VAMGCWAVFAGNKGGMGGVGGRGVAGGGGGTSDVCGYVLPLE